MQNVCVRPLFLESFEETRMLSSYFIFSEISLASTLFYNDFEKFEITKM